MSIYTNADLSRMVDASNALFVGATNVATNPYAANTGNSGDYLYSDPSLFFKVGTTWYAIDASGVTAV